MQVMREGSDITLVAFSKMVGYCLRAAEMLEKDGVSCEVRRHPAAGPTCRARNCGTVGWGWGWGRGRHLGWTGELSWTLHAYFGRCCHYVVVGPVSTIRRAALGAYAR
jgi:hypothetical protein